MRPLLSILFLAFFACTQATGQETRQELAPGALYEVGYQSSGDVTIHTVAEGEQPRVVITGKQSDLEEVEVKFTERGVKINRGGSWGWTNSAPTVAVYVTALEKVALAGSGDVVVKDPVKVEEFRAAVSGSGSITARLEVNSAKLAVSGSGDLKMSGSAQSVKVSLAGSGDISALDLQVNSAEVAISGSGDVEMNVEGDISVSIAGSGDMAYKGDAEVSSRVAGSGQVRKL